MNDGALIDSAARWLEAKAVQQETLNSFLWMDKLVAMTFMVLFAAFCVVILWLVCKEQNEAQ